MEYQKIINLFDNTPDQPSKFRTKNCVKVNYDSQGTYNSNSQIKFKTSNSSLQNHSDAYILVKGTATVPNTAAANNGDKKVLFKDCISEINNAQINNPKDIDVVMPMYNLIEYSDNYSEISEDLWQYCRDKPYVNNNCVVIAFNAGSANDSFKFTEKNNGSNGR